MNKELKDLALWKNGLCPHELMAFKRGLFDRIYKMLIEKAKGKESVIMSEEKPKELQKKEELEKTGKIGGKKPIDIIRGMNPGKFIPTGAEMAKIMEERKNK